MSHDLRDLLERTARGPCDDDFDPGGIAVRARPQHRIGVAAVAVGVLAGLAGGVLWVGSLGGTPPAPYVDASPPAHVSDTWQRVTVGNGELAVPGDWAIVDLDQDPTAYCTRFRGDPALYLGSDPSPAPTCPPRQLDPAVGVQAVGFELLGGRFEGDPVEINGHAGFVTEQDDGVHQYVFPDLALMLDVHSQPDPELAEQVLSTLRHAEASSSDPTPPQPSATPQASDTRQPTDLDIGPALDADALPAMGSHGVAVQGPAGVVFVGLDGTVHGHLAGAELALGGRAVHVPGPVPVHLPRAVDEEADDRWIRPSSGSTSSLYPSTPLWHDHHVVQLETGLDPSPLVLRHEDGADSEELARFSPNGFWDVSADHRVVSWHECQDGGGDLDTCVTRVYDTDMAAEWQLDPACSVSDSFADFNHAVVCSSGPDGTSWIERHGSWLGPEPEVVRFGLPRYDDQPDDTPDIGYYYNAFLAGEHIVATWSTECEVRRPVVIPPDGVPRPLVGDDFATSPAGVVLGTTQDGDAILHVTEGCGSTDRPDQMGIHLVDPGTGETTPVILSDSLIGAEMWSPQPP